MTWPQLRYVRGYTRGHLSEMVHLVEGERRINSHARNVIERLIAEGDPETPPPSRFPCIAYELVPVEAMDAIRAFVAAFGPESDYCAPPEYDALPDEVKP